MHNVDSRAAETKIFYVPIRSSVPLVHVASKPETGYFQVRVPVVQFSILGSIPDFQFFVLSIPDS